MSEKCIIAIDLKSFYASVECVERGLDPLTTKLVVADESRTEKTICLAVSPALKAYGISGRARLFEVIEKTKNINVDYIIATPRMALYMDYSTRIYNIYLKYISPEDIHIYSVDEVFIDATSYLNAYKCTGVELAKKMMRHVLDETGITATCGIGTNLYLAKIAMDIVAKHMPGDETGARIASLNEYEYRKKLWTHTPISDFWRIGKGYAKALEEVGLYNMGSIARCSLGDPYSYYNEDLLYNLFGVNAELLIDHAWGYEPVDISDVKAYKPKFNSINHSQVLQEPYTYEKAKIIVKEMANSMVLDLVDKRLCTDQIVLTIGYDIENLTNPSIKKKYNGPIVKDGYGRKLPKHSHGTENLSFSTSSTKLIVDASLKLYEKLVNKNLLIRRITLVANKVVPENEAVKSRIPKQLDFFTDFEAINRQAKEEEAAIERERRLQEAELSIRKKFGKNAILKGTSLEEGATAMDRNAQIGGHRS